MIRDPLTLGLGGTGITEEELQEESARIIQRKWRENRAINNPGADEASQMEEDLAQQALEKEQKLKQDYKVLYHAREKLLVENATVQRKLSHHYTEKKAQEGEKPNAAVGEQSVMEIENRYVTWLNKIHEERVELDQTRVQNDETLNEYRAQVEARKKKADDFEKKFSDFKQDKCLAAEYTRTGKTLSANRVAHFENEEAQKNEEVRQERIKYIKMRNRMDKLAHLLKEKEKLTDGLHLIDFEQLKIENTTLNEKIEERNEDLLKLKKKATTTIHILTHVKEKLQFIQGENHGLKKQLAKLEADLAEHRDRLTSVKRDRDLLVNDNVKMREKMPMVGAEDLLVDYEHRKKEIERLRGEVVALKNRHHSLFSWIAANTQQMA